MMMRHQKKFSLTTILPPLNNKTVVAILAEIQMTLHRVITQINIQMGGFVILLTTK